MGSPDRYPVDADAKTIFIPEAYAILERYARATNLAFNLLLIAISNPTVSFLIH
jgi:hypothetical protein